MQSLIENSPPHDPEGEPVAAEGNDTEAAHQVANESWELMQQVQRGRAEGASPRDVRKANEAFGAIYDRYYDEVFRVIYRRVQNHALTEDLTTDTFLRALKGAERYKWQGKDLGAWLSTIAINLTIDHFGKAHTRYVTGSIDAKESGAQLWPDETRMGRPEAAAIGAVERERLIDAIRQLSPDQQQAVVLRYFEEMSIEETAAQTGKTIGAIKALTYRAVRALKDILEAERVSPEVPAPLLLDTASSQLFEAFASNKPVPDAQEEVSETLKLDSESAEDMQDEDTLTVSGAVQHRTPDIGWEGPTLLRSVQPGELPQNTYIAAVTNRFLSEERLEELSNYIVAAHKARDRLAAGEVHGEEYAELQYRIDLGVKARRVIAAHHLRFAVGVALRYSLRTHAVDDLIQAANVGLVKAAEKFDPYYMADDDTPDNQARTFTTTAQGHVRGRILSHLNRERRDYHLRGQIDKDTSQLLKRSYEEAKRLDPEVTYSQVAAWLGFKIEDRRLLQEGRMWHEFLDVDSEYLRDIIHSIRDPRSDSEFERIEKQESGTRFWQYLESILPSHYFKALHMYYVDGQTQDAIAEEMGVVRSRVWHLLERSREIIRKAIEGGDPRERRRRGKGKRKDGTQIFFRKIGVPVAEDADPEALRSQLSKVFESIDLTPTERAIARLRYGLDTEDGSETSQHEAAEKLGLSRGYVSLLDPKIQKRAREYLGLAETKEDTPTT